MQFTFFHLLILSILAVVFISPVLSHSEADLEALVGLQENVNEYLANSNMDAATKKKIQDMMAKKEESIGKSLGKK